MPFGRTVFRNARRFFFLCRLGNMRGPKGSCREHRRTGRAGIQSEVHDPRRPVALQVCLPRPLATFACLLWLVSDRGERVQLGPESGFTALAGSKPARARLQHRPGRSSLLCVRPLGRTQSGRGGSRFFHRTPSAATGIRQPTRPGSDPHSGPDSLRRGVARSTPSPTRLISKTPEL